MKNIVLTSVATALLVFSGCSDKDSAAQPGDAKEVSAVKTETVSSDKSIINAGSGSDMSNGIASIYFGFDEFTVNANMSDSVTSNASAVKGHAIKLEGNCDEWGSDEYNFALGLKRADAVKKALVAQGVDSNSITMVSFGESNPTCNDKTQACWAKNRRVDVTIK